jgi:hypothetical protein
MVSWFVPQNQVAYGLLIAPQNRWEDEDGTGHALKSSGLLHLEESQDMVSQSEYFCLAPGIFTNAIGSGFQLRDSSTYASQSATRV